MPGQLGFKYVYIAKHINDVLAKVRDTGRPDKLTIDIHKNLLRQEYDMATENPDARTTG